MSIRRYSELNPETQVRLPGINYGGINSNDIQYASNMAGHLSDYAMGRGDFAEPNWKKIKGEDSIFMEADSTSNENNNNNASNFGNSNNLRASGGSSVSGIKGKFYGNTNTKPGFEKYYFERDIFNSRKIITRDLLWGFSKHAIKDVNGAYIQLDRTNAPGVVNIPSDLGTDSLKINIFKPFSDNEQGCNVSIADHCYSHAINFHVADFFDKKILSENGGALRNFVKCRLLEFSIKIDIITRSKTAHDLSNDIYNVYERANGIENFTKVTTIRGPQEDASQKYWIYRDLHGEYLSNISTEAAQNIPITPPDSKLGVMVDTLPRTCHQIRAYDNNLCIASDNDPFYFKRTIKSSGSYYITPANIYAMRAANISLLVNEVENQHTNNLVINSLPEHFNLLIVPTNCEWYMTHSMPIITAGAKGRIICASKSTHLAITCKATWQAFNYNHKGVLESAGKFESNNMEPLDLMQLNYKANTINQHNKINKNIL